MHPLVLDPFHVTHGLKTQWYTLADTKKIRGWSRDYTISPTELYTVKDTSCKNGLAKKVATQLFGMCRRCTYLLYMIHWQGTLHYWHACWSGRVDRDCAFASSSFGKPGGNRWVCWCTVWKPNWPRLSQPVGWAPSCPVNTTAFQYCAAEIALMLSSCPTTSALTTGRRK